MYLGYVCRPRDDIVLPKTLLWGKHQLLHTGVYMTYITDKRRDTVRPNTVIPKADVPNVCFFSSSPSQIS